MANSTQVEGILLSIDVPRGARYGEIVVQYGEQRKEKKGAAIQYINAAKIKIPERVIEKLQQVKVGELVEVLCRIQGVLYQGSSGPVLSTELVASSVSKSRLPIHMLRKELKSASGREEAAAAADESTAEVVAA